MYTGSTLGRLLSVRIRKLRTIQNRLAERNMRATGGACDAVSPKRVRLERVSSYGTQPVPIVTRTQAVWATESAWYSLSTEGAVGWFERVREHWQNVSRFVAAIN